jgi:hypothetical protein
VHIYNLSRVIVHAVKKEPNVAQKQEDLSFRELRSRTLENFRTASEALKAAKEKDLEDDNIIFRGNSGDSVLPFWNLLNGPIADVLWHVGQVVSFRRSSGNPFDGRNNVLTGKREE